MNTLDLQDEKNTNIENFQTIAELEKEHIYKALKLANGNKTKAAIILGITLKSVYNKLKLYYQEDVQNNLTNSQESEDEQ